jgi:predicted nucleic acid-binding protein
LGLLIDASVLIAAERGRLDLAPLAAVHGSTTAGIAAVTASELLHGVHGAETPARRHRREAWVETVLTSLAVFPFDLTAARVHARLWAELWAGGASIGAHDLLVAATALAAGFSVATRDLRSFPRIPGLRVERW